MSWYCHLKPTNKFNLLYTASKQKRQFYEYYGFLHFHSFIRKRLVCCWLATEDLNNFVFLLFYLFVCFFLIQGRSENMQYTRSPSPSCRHRLASNPTPSFGANNSSGQHVSNNLNLTPYPSPMVSPTPSFSSLLNSLAYVTSSTCNSPVPTTTTTPASPLVRRNRSPMLCSLNKMNSVQSSSSTTSNQSQGSTTSLCCLAMTSTSTPFGALQPELYKRETSIHVGLPADDLDHSDHSTNESSSSDHVQQPSSSYHQQMNSSCSRSVPISVTSTAATASPAQKSSTSSIRSNSNIPLGRLHFRLSYDFDKSDLLVHLIEGMTFVNPLQRLLLMLEFFNRCSTTLSLHFFFFFLRHANE